MYKRTGLISIFIILIVFGFIKNLFAFYVFNSNTYIFNVIFDNPTNILNPTEIIQIGEKIKEENHFDLDVYQVANSHWIDIYRSEDFHIKYFVDQWFDATIPGECSHITLNRDWLYTFQDNQLAFTNAAMYTSSNWINETFNPYDPHLDWIIMGMDRYTLEPEHNITWHEIDEIMKTPYAWLGVIFNYIEVGRFVYYKQHIGYPMSKIYPNGFEENILPQDLQVRINATLNNLDLLGYYYNPVTDLYEEKPKGK